MSVSAHFSVRDMSDNQDHHSGIDMKRIMFLCSFVVLACVVAAVSACGGTQPVPSPERELTDPASITSPVDPSASAIALNDLFASAQGRSAIWSNDGGSVIYASTRNGSWDLWRQSVDSGEAQQISDFAGAKRALHMMPDGKHILFQADADGHAIHDLYVVGLRRGDQPKNLTSTPKIDEAHPLLSADGRWLAFTIRPATEPSGDLALMDMESGKVRRLTHESVPGVQWAAIAFSGDGSKLLANRYDYGMTFSEVHEVDVRTGGLTRKTDSGTYVSASDMTPDGRLAAVSMESAKGIRQAAVLDLESGTSTFLDPGQWEQKTTDISPDGRYLLYVTDQNARQQVYVHDIDNGDNRRLPFPEGVNATGGYVATLPVFSPDGHHILFPHSSGAEPLDFWIYALGKKHPRRITHLSGLGKKHLPGSSIVNYSSFDGTTISAIMWMPYNLERNGSSPAVILAHGGPTGQIMDRFNKVATALCSRGYVVLAPNFRGSTGYGKDFLNANKMDLGEGDLKDLLAGVKFLEKTGYVDSGKVGIYGGSYGGYLTLMALAKTDVFAAGVDMFGIVNWRTMWKFGSPDQRRYQSGLIGTPEDNPDVYDRTSPLTFLDGLTEPLLVLQGENDPLVPAKESRQVIEFLQSRHRTVDFRFYENEGHGFRHPSNRRDSIERTIRWFEHYLEGKDVSAKGEPS